MTEQEHEEHRYRCLIREICRLTHERGTGWLRGFVDGWKRWPALRDDFWKQQRLGNIGEPGDWRE